MRVFHADEKRGSVLDRRVAEGKDEDDLLLRTAAAIAKNFPSGSTIVDTPKASLRYSFEQRYDHPGERRVCGCRKPILIRHA